MSIHTVFDILAVLTGLLVFWLVRPAGAGGAPPWRRHPAYLPVASFGMMAGAVLFGTANLWLSGYAEIGKSVLGGLAGAILAIELLKHRTGITGSTGVRLAAPLAAAIAVGRIGCYLSGIEDRTYGTPTELPWGHDFGDGVLRHPVQLYESATMAVFAVLFVILLRRGDPVANRAGFQLFIGVYAGQRFLWELLKPYAAVLGPLNLFHLVCLGLLIYAWVYGRAELAHAQPVNA